MLFRDQLRQTAIATVGATRLGILARLAYLRERDICRDERGRFAPCGAAAGVADDRTSDPVEKAPGHTITDSIRADRQSRKIAEDLKVLHQRQADVDARAQKLRAEMRALEKKAFDPAADPQSRERQKKLAAQYHDLARRLDANREERESYRRMAHDRLRLPAGKQGAVAIAPEAPLAERETRSVRAAQSFVQSVSAHPVTVTMMPAAAGARRAGYSQRTRTIHNDESSVIDPGTTVHELGHPIEHQHPRVLDAARRFHDRRCGEEPPRPMNEFDVRFGRELGRDDLFARVFSSDANDLGARMRARYTGKLYKAGGRTQATEIVSMGLEQLYRDPTGFAARDPEYCRFMIGVLHGRIK